MSSRDEIVARYKEGTLPQMFVEQVRLSRSADISEEFSDSVVNLHNARVIDLLTTLRSISSSNIKQTDFFVFVSSSSKLLPRLEASVQEVLTATKALVERGGNDLAAGLPNDAFRSWAEIGDRAEEVLRDIDVDDPTNTSYIFLALQALAQEAPELAFNHVTSLLSGGSNPARWAAAKAVGTMPLKTSELRLKAINALKSAYELDGDDGLLGHVLYSICEIVLVDIEHEAAALKFIEEVDSKVKERSIFQVSLQLMFNGAKLSTELNLALASVVQKVSLDHRGTLDNIDSAACSLIKQGRVKEGVNLITPILSAYDSLDISDVFDSCSHALSELPSDEIAEVVTKWLLTFDDNLGVATLGLIRGRCGSPLIFDFDVDKLSVSSEEAIIAAHRAVGYLFVHPISATSFVLSLLPKVDKKSQELLINLVFDPLLISFSGGLSKWLKSKLSETDGSIKQHILNLLGKLDDYLDGLQKVGWIKELRPSERERLIEMHRQQEAMRQAHKKAQKMSVFNSILRRSVLLYGNRSISYFKRPDGSVERSEMKMHSMSHSFEAPRLDILEPLSLDYKLRVLRSKQSIQ